MTRPASASFCLLIALMTSASVCRCSQSTFPLFRDRRNHDQHPLTVVARTSDPAASNFDISLYCRSMCEQGRGGNLCRCNAAFFQGKRSPAPMWSAVSTSGDVISGGGGCANGPTCALATEPSTRTFASVATRSTARSYASSEIKKDKKKRKFEAGNPCKVAGRGSKICTGSHGTAHKSRRSFANSGKNIPRDLMARAIANLRPSTLSLNQMRKLRSEKEPTTVLWREHSDFNRRGMATSLTPSRSDIPGAVLVDDRDIVGPFGTLFAFDDGAPIAVSPGRSRRR